LRNFLWTNRFTKRKVKKKKTNGLQNKPSSNCCAKTMRVHPATVIALVMVVLIWPVSAFAKRGAPKPVSPVVWEGVEYRAPLNVEQMGHVQAVDIISGQKLWETKVYHVWINPLLETDVQWIFITNLQVQDRKLLVRNEAGKIYKLDLKTGRVDGVIQFWLPWVCVGILLLLTTFLIGKKILLGQQMNSSDSKDVANTQTG
jgi:outer membrane protein assembly factor BamB